MKDRICTNPNCRRGEVPEDALVCGQISHRLPGAYVAQQMQAEECASCGRHVNEARDKEYRARVKAETDYEAGDPDYMPEGLMDYHYFPGIGCGRCGKYWVPEWAQPAAVAA